MATIPMTVKNTGRRRVCSVYKCKNNKTYAVQRGKHTTLDSLFLCDDCFRDLMGAYVDTVGVEKAR